MGTTSGPSKLSPAAATLLPSAEPLDPVSATSAAMPSGDEVDSPHARRALGTISAGETRLGDPRSAFTSMRLGPDAALRSNAVRAWAAQPESPTWSVYNAAVDRRFTATDRARMSVLMTPRADQTTVDYIVQRTREAGPQWLAEMNSRYFVYEDGRADGGSGPRSTYSALETLRNGGVCRDQMGFMTAVLNSAGYRAFTVGYDSAGTSHAVTLYQDPSTARWGVVEYGRVHMLDAQTPAQAMVRFAPGALAFDLYRNNGYERVSVGSRFYTDRGLRLFNALRAGDQPAGFGEIGAAAGTDGLAATAPLGANTSIFARSFGGEPGLDAQLGGVAHRFSNGARVTAGVGSLRFDERTIGPRQMFHRDQTFAFVTFDQAGRISQTSVAPGVTFETGFDSAVTLGFAPGDPSVSSALTDVRANVNATLRARVAPGVEVYGRGVAGIGTATVKYVMTDGRDIGTLPLNRRFEAGVHYTPSSNVFVDAKIELPFGVQADNLHDRPALDLRGGALLGDWAVMAGARASLSGRSEVLSAGGSGVDTVYVGVQRSFSAGTVALQAYSGSQYGERNAGASIGFRTTPGALLSAVSNLGR